MAVECKRNSFCFICANFITSSTSYKITSKLKELIKESYGIKQLNGLDGENQFAPSFIDSACRTRLLRFRKGEGELKFDKPAFWRRPNLNHTDCFCCRTIVHKFNHHFGESFVYPDASKMNVKLPVLKEPVTTPISPVISTATTSDSISNISN